MKVLICGSRDINDRAVVAPAVAQSGMALTHIVSGGARGVDTLARLYAQSNGIEFTEHVADWEGRGRRAGYLRNITMVDDVEAVIAVWDGGEPWHEAFDRLRHFTGETGLGIKT